MNMYYFIEMEIIYVIEWNVSFDVVFLHFSKYDFMVIL